MRKKRLCFLHYISIFVLLLSCPLVVIAQDTIAEKLTDDSDIQQELESLAEQNNTESEDYTDLLELLNYYKHHPLNLNTATIEELQQLHYINAIQINNLLIHIKNTGKLLTVYELQSIDGFDLQTINKILPYIIVTDNSESTRFSIKEMFTKGQNSILLRYARIIEPQVGFSKIDSTSLFKSPNSRYIGSPDYLYARYKFNYRTNVSWGITAEKDQGELFFKNKQNFKYDWYTRSLKGNQHNGFDFYSAHFFLHNIKFIKSLAIGDYQVSFGQGLTAWSAPAFGKSINILNVKKSGLGISPYTSVDENKFMRGAATTLFYKRFEATGFFSRHYVDATISDTSLNGSTSTISALQTTGLHTTPAEIANKHSILQTIYGGNLSYKSNRFNIGITAVDYQLNHEFNRNLTYYNQFEFSSTHNYNIGIDYNFIVHNINLFGEEAISKNGGKAFVNGALISLDPKLCITILHRYYELGYQNLISKGFGESSGTNNERGIYLGAILKPNNTITVTATYDKFVFPYLKYQVDAPSFGNDYMIQLNYTHSKKLEMYFNIRQQNQQQNSATSIVDINYVVPLLQTNYRFDIVYTIIPSLKLKNRVELINYKLGDNSTEKGYLVVQDISYHKMGKSFLSSLGYSLFQTDSYNARIYAYTSDIPGSYSIPSYYYRGSSFFVMLQYSFTRKLEMWIRYSQIYYDNQNVISSGSLSQINGGTKSEIKVQIKFKFY